MHLTHFLQLGHYLWEPFSFQAQVHLVLILCVCVLGLTPWGWITYQGAHLWGSLVFSLSSH